MSFGIPVRNGLGVGLLASTFLSSLRIGGRPAMSLDFIGTNSLDSRVTFTRGTTATFVGINGLIQTAAINAPRFDYDSATLAPKGLLIEEARTNLQIQSETFNDIAWSLTNATITADATVAPDGTSTADKLAETNAAGEHRILTNIGIVTVAAAPYTWSVFVKAAERTVVQLRNNSLQGATFDLANNGAASSITPGFTASAVALSNGWFRLLLSGNAAGVAERVIVNLVSGGTNSYTGTTGSGVFLWGAQLEAGAFATSYIPTTLLAVPRNADVAQMTGTNFSSWYNQTEGTIVANCSYTALDTLVGICGADAGNGDNAQVLRGEPTNLRTLTRSAGASTSSFVLSPGMNPAGSKAAYAYALNNCAAYANGLAATGTSGALPAVNLTKFTIGAEAFGTYLNGHIRSIDYYNTRLPNAQLQALTL